MTSSEAEHFNFWLVLHAGTGFTLNLLQSHQVFPEHSLSRLWPYFLSSAFRSGGGIVVRRLRACLQAVTCPREAPLHQKHQ